MNKEILTVLLGSALLVRLNLTSLSSQQVSSISGECLTVAANFAEEAEKRGLLKEEAWQ